MKNNKSTKDKKTFTPEEREKFLYHNTLKLLQKYRDVVWSIEASVMQARINFELEFDCAIDEFLEMSYAAGADLSGSKVEAQMQTIDKSKRMIQIVDNAVDVMRRKNKNGEKFYWILYYTYLSEQEPPNVESIISSLREHFVDISHKTYYRKRNDAINCLSSVLWGYTSKDCIDLINVFIEKK